MFKPELPTTTISLRMALSVAEDVMHYYEQDLEKEIEKRRLSYRAWDAWWERHFWFLSPFVEFFSPSGLSVESMAKADALEAMSLSKWAVKHAASQIIDFCKNIEDQTEGIHALHVDRIEKMTIEVSLSDFNAMCKYVYG